MLKLPGSDGTLKKWSNSPVLFEKKYVLLDNSISFFEYTFYEDDPLHIS